MGEKENTISTTVLVVLGLAGLGVIATSMILVYVMARRLAGSAGAYLPLPGVGPLPALTPAQDPAWQQTPGWDLLPAAAEGAGILLAGPPPGTDFGSMTYTYSLSTGDPVCVASSFSDRKADIVLRTVGPPGTAAIVSTSLPVLRQVDIAFPVGRLIAVPFGEPQAVTLGPGEQLYARATVDNVLLSVTRSGSAPVA